jgi:AcrR family transcriptional regulator
VNTEQSKPSPGRPKTLDRARALDTAIRSYWTDGVDGVSMNEICRRAEVSKPGLYREFGNEDGLMKAALIQYFDSAYAPIHQILAADAPFRKTLDTFITFASADRVDQGIPNGCLFVQMYNARARTGVATRDQLDCLQKQVLSAYEGWLERSKAKGEFSKLIPTQFAAVYIDAQFCSAMSQQARGEKAETIRDVLKLAFSVFE